jgi:S-DNA-T family DNA segregation ATPase FtsK/SpoIIIE
MQLLNINFLYNIGSINKMYMIDLKGGVELKEYELINKIEFVSDILKLDSLLDNIIQDLKDTQKFMLDNNIRKYNKYTLIVFDEIGAISVYPDKKLRESIFNKLSLIAMQGRSSGHLLFMFAQKIDNTILPTTITNNIQSRVLLKTSNDYNINIIDLKDNIRERITTTEIQDFCKGRAIYKNGLTSEKYLIQFPFISDKFLSSIIKYFSK